MGIRSFTIEFKISITDNADPLKVIEGMEYNFFHERIVETEIVDFVIADEIIG
jgi:hypothetical protein